MGRRKPHKAILIRITGPAAEALDTHLRALGLEPTPAQRTRYASAAILACSPQLVEAIIERTAATAAWIERNEEHAP